MLSRSHEYPPATLQGPAAVLLHAYHQVRQVEEREGAGSDSFAALCAYALDQGAKQLACTGPKMDHAAQAACLLTLIGRLKLILDGFYGTSGDERDAEEMRALQEMVWGLSNLLQWHFENGAGALLPIAQNMGLVQ